MGQRRNFKIFSTQMLIRLIVVIILQYIQVSNHYVVHLKLIQSCMLLYLNLKKREKERFGPGLVAQLVRVPAQYAKVAGSIPGQGTNKNQPMNT